MHYLRLTAVGLVCALSEAVVAAPDNFARDASLDTFEELAPGLDAEVPNMHITAVRVSHDTKFKHSPETLDSRKLGPREASEPAGYAVTITVTSTPESCTTHTEHGSLPSKDAVKDAVQSETVQVISNSATEAYIAAVPTAYKIPNIIPGPPVKVPGNSAVSNTAVRGAAATSGKIQFPGANNTVSTSSLSPTKSGSSTPIPTAGAMKDSSAGLLLTVLLAIFGNFLIL
ncbi:hypothetical protein MMC31_002591 [Peltigera leucophlebia]|nr:hypothetical protein [Peltigera leucophlebia]